MVDDIICHRIIRTARFKQLVGKRKAFSLLLSAILIVFYFGLILLIAFAPDWLGTPLNEETSVTRGIPIGIGIIVISFLLCAIYVWRANGEFEQMIKQLLSEVKG